MYLTFCSQVPVVSAAKLLSVFFRDHLLYCSTSTAEPGIHKRSRKPVQASKQRRRERYAHACGDGADDLHDKQQSAFRRRARWRPQAARVRQQDVPQAGLQGGASEVCALSVNMLMVSAWKQQVDKVLIQVAKFAEDLSLEELEVETTGCLGACSPPCRTFVPARFESVSFVVALRLPRCSYSEVEHIFAQGHVVVDRHMVSCRV